MKKVINIIFVCLILCQNYSYSKDGIKLNPRKKYPFGASVNLLGPSGHLSVSINTFVIPKINVELGTGVYNTNGFFVPSSYLGVKYHFGGNTISRTTFYLGVYDDFSFDFQKHYLYFPFGINRIKINQFTWSLEIALQPDKIYYKSTMWGAFKVGYQFGFNKQKNKIFKQKK